MLDDLRREYKVKKALQAIAKQRVALVLQPGNVEVIECAPPDEEWFDTGVRTARIRGWVDVLHENLPTGNMKMIGDVPHPPSQMPPKTHYKLTEAGWAVLNRSHGWVLATFIVSTLGLVISVAALIVAWLSMPKS